MDKGMSEYLIAILIFCLLTSVGLFVMGNFVTKDPTIVDTSVYGDFADKFNKTSKATSEINNLYSDISSKDNNVGLFGFLDTLIGSAWNTLILLGSSFSFMNDAFYGMTKFIGIPIFVPLIITTTITVILLFAIVAALFRWKV